MSWHVLVQAYKSLQMVDAESADFEPAWEVFSKQVLESSSCPPYHIRLLLRRLDDFREERPREDIAILDHGCGGALTLFYMAVLGYTNFWGLDVGGDLAILNTIAAKKFGHEENRLSVYGGQKVPLPDESLDFVFSQQVIEHLNDQSLEPYYQEEGRILKQGGLAVHYVPHRLVPYDSHTKTWLIHYLPQPLYRSLARLLGSPVPDHLHLRWPWVHRALIERYVGSSEDVSVSRLSNMPEAESYDGSVMIRRLISTVMNIPILKVAAGFVLSDLVMLETISVKS